MRLNRATDASQYLFELDVQSRLSLTSRGIA